MKNIFILLLFCALNTNAQTFNPISETKRNNVWLNGYSNAYLLTHPNDTLGAGGVVLNFQNTNIVNRQYNQLDFVGTNASICDTAGNLLFYTNGLHVGNKNLRKMVGRDTLNIGHTTDILLNNPNHAGMRCYRVHQGSIILPLPNNDSIFYIFHARTADPPLINNIGIPLCDRLLYSIVNMQRDSGRGEVITINEPIINYDTLAYGMLSACRHANGRDWWLIVWKYDSNKYMPILFDPTGIHPQGWQIVPSAIGLHTIQGQTCFSPDGRFYARHEGYDWQDGTGNWLDIFEFDRCTGLLSNQTTINVPVAEGVVGSVAFSPNSNLLYAGTSYHIFQYDMTVPLAQVAATQDTVGRYDYFNDQGFPTFYYTMQLAPNNKIYLCTSSSTRYYHIIDNPNVRGTGCNVINHGLFLGTYQWQTIPNQAYFPLGPLDGSPCDTLGIDNIDTTYTTKTPEINPIKVFPNPTNGILNIDIGESDVSLSYKIYDMLGRQVQDGALNNGLTINIKTLTNGVYFLSLSDKNGGVYRAVRFVVQRG